MELDLVFIFILIATFATAFLSSIFGMLGGLILMGILISFLSVGPAMVLHGLIQATSNGYRELGLIEMILIGRLSSPY